MTEQTATVFSNQSGITTRVCPRGHVYLLMDFVVTTVSLP